MFGLRKRVAALEERLRKMDRDAEIAKCRHKYFPITEPTPIPHILTVGPRGEEMKFRCIVCGHEQTVTLLSEWDGNCIAISPREEPFYSLAIQAGWTAPPCTENTESV